MPTYEYQCEGCGLQFERRQTMTDLPLTECPSCQGKVRRLMSGGAGFILKGSGNSHTEHIKQGCSLEQVGKTCCGREQRCGKLSCNED
ncbi:MAG: zinc ribbon domain-containing protein [Nitrospirota bacterium]